MKKKKIFTLVSLSLIGIFTFSGISLLGQSNSFDKVYALEKIDSNLTLEDKLNLLNEKQKEVIELSNHIDGLHQEKELITQNIEEINSNISKHEENISNLQKEKETLLQKTTEIKDRLAKEKAEKEAERQKQLEKASSSSVQRDNGEAPEGRVLMMESTAYSSDTADLLGGGTMTATGQNLLANPNAVAVDPNVIPLGTKLWVEGYGYTTAVDVGGAIKNMIVDVHFPTAQECISWGRRQVKVVILD